MCPKHSGPQTLYKHKEIVFFSSVGQALTVVNIAVTVSECKPLINIEVGVQILSQSLRASSCYSRS